MKICVTVRSVMTENVVSVEKKDPIIKAIKLMTEKNIGSVIVTDGGKAVGILTERDILRRCCPERLCERGIKVGDVMSHPLITIEADASLGEAAMLMLDKNIRRLLVVENGKPVGIVTQKDIMRGTIETFMALSSV